MSGKKSSKSLKSETLFDQLLSSIDQEFGSEHLSAYYDDPVLFAREVLHCEPEPEQCEILRALAEHKHVACRSGHGIGKSTSMAIAILWFMSTRLDAKVPVTGPTFPAQ